MMKFITMLLMALSLSVTSVAAVECCVQSHQETPAGSASKDKQDHKALAGHHCACQHVVADRDLLPSFSYVRQGSVAPVVAFAEPMYFSLSHGPLPEPPSRA